MKSPASVKNVLDAAGSSKVHLTGLHDSLRKRLAHFKRHRSMEDQAAMQEDFCWVLNAWGIDDHAQIPDAILALKLRFPIFAVPILVCILAVFFMPFFITWMTSFLITIPCLLGMITTMWRISILRKHHFQPLSIWILSLLGLKRGCS